MATPSTTISAGQTANAASSWRLNAKLARLSLLTIVMASLAVPTSAGLPACEYEDSQNCYWDAAARGNGQGRSFIDVGGVVLYVEREG